MVAEAATRISRQLLSRTANGDRGFHLRVDGFWCYGRRLLERARRDGLQRLHFTRNRLFVVAKNIGRDSLIDVKDNRSNTRSNPSDDDSGKLDPGHGKGK